MQNKKIGFSSAILLTMSSMIGAGVFVKSQNLNKLSHNNTTFIVLLMGIGIFMVLALLMSLSLIVSKQVTAQGYIEWTKKYCPTWFNVFAINFTRFIYQPVGLLMIGTYVVELLKNKYSLSVSATIICSFSIVLVFMLINIISFDFAKKIQLILLFIVFIPIISLPIIGFIDSFKESVVVNTVQEKATSLNGIGPWMIIISGLPTIFFMYDGFYSTLSLREKLKDPEKLNIVLVVAFALVTVIYAYLIFAFKYGAPNTGNYEDFATIQKYPILSQIFNLAIGCSALLTLNSGTMSSVRQLYALHNEYKFKDIDFLKRKLFQSVKKHNHKFEYELTIWIYLIIKMIIWYAIVGVLSVIVDAIYGSKENILNINSALADVTSSLIFAIIAVVIINLTKSLKNHLPNKKIKFYKYSSNCASFLIFIAIFYTYLNYFVGMFGYNNANQFLCFFKLLLVTSFIIISCYPYIRLYAKRLINYNSYKLLNLISGKNKYSLTKFKN